MCSKLIHSKCSKFILIHPCVLIHVHLVSTKFQMTCRTICRILTNKVGRETKLKLYKVMAVSVLSYECELWTITKKQKSKIHVSETTFLNRVKICFTEWRHKRRIGSLWQNETEVLVSDDGRNVWVNKSRSLCGTWADPGRPFDILSMPYRGGSREACLRWGYIWGVNYKVTHLILKIVV